MFRVGQKVVCVDASPMSVAAERYPNMIEEKRIYTIRGYFESPKRSNPLVYLVEIVNPTSLWLEGCMESPFPARRFRPVVERETDISIFTAMLNTTKVTERT